MHGHMNVTFKDHVPHTFSPKWEVGRVQVRDLQMFLDFIHHVNRQLSMKLQLCFIIGLTFI